MKSLITSTVEKFQDDDGCFVQIKTWFFSLGGVKVKLFSSRREAEQIEEHNL